jgi:hypothetical protein
MKSADELHVRLQKKDRETLELIRSTFGLSLSAAVRVCIRAAAQKLGLQKETMEDNLMR